MTRSGLSRLALRGAAFLVAVAVASVLAIGAWPRGGHADASTPSPIARAMPSGAVAYLESDDLAGAIDAWRDSKLRAAWSKTEAAERMGRSMLYLRLSERVAALERIAGLELDLDELAAVTGRRAGIAVYDLSDTIFVLQAELPSASLASHPLARARKRFDGRKHAGVEYFVAKDDETGAELGFAIVGARLVVSNSPARLQEALLLAAREEKVKTDGKPGASLGEDPAFAALLAAAPTTAHLRVYVHMSALAGTHQFDDFWIFGGGSKRLEGLDRALLTLSVKDGVAEETRTMSYLDPALRPVAAKGTIAWPKTGFHEEVAGADATSAAARIARLLPSIAVETLDGKVERGAPPDVTGRIAAALAEAQPTRAYETVVVETVKGRLTPRERRAGAVVLRLAAADKLDPKALEAAIVDHVRWVTSDGAPVPMAFAGGSLKIPLVDDVTPTVLLDGSTLVVATDAALAKKALAAAPLLDAKAPVGSRLDLAAAGARWRAIAAVVGARADWYDSADRDFVVDVIPGLLDAAGARTVETTGHTQDPYYVEQVRYR